MKRVTIDYTVYSPDYVFGRGECWDFRTLHEAKNKARELGVGNYCPELQPSKAVGLVAKRVLLAVGRISFRRSRSLSEKQWKADSSSLSQTSVLRRFRFGNR